MRRIFQDFRRLGSNRQSKKLSCSRNQNEISTVNSCSLFIEDEEKLPLDTGAAAVLIECPVCTLILPPSSYPVFERMLCGHRTCFECLRCYLTVEINESRTDVSCPVCSAFIHPDEVRNLLVKDLGLLQKYEEFSLRRALVVDPDVRWCPAPDCG